MAASLGGVGWQHKFRKGEGYSHEQTGIQSGYGGAVPLWGGDMADLTKQVTQGASMWVFKLPRVAKN